MKSIENRVPPPLVAIVFAIAMWAISIVDPNIGLSQTVRVSAIALLWLLGTAFSFAGVISFKLSKTTVNPLKPDTASALVTSGIYQITRNPMYVGFVVFLLAWATYLSSVGSLVVVAVFIAFIQRFQIIPEERALLSLFGQEFEDYTGKVRRWL
jgi:protein-S-isoprenylcysteine O-methyltransferase Ste14